jgi:hypothetical protein
MFACFQGEVTTELKEKLYEFHVRWQKEVGEMFRSIPELKMQNPSMSDMQIRQFLLYDLAHGLGAIGYPVDRAVFLSCFAFVLFAHHIQIKLFRFYFQH